MAGLPGTAAWTKICYQGVNTQEKPGRGRQSLRLQIVQAGGNAWDLETLPHPADGRYAKTGCQAWGLTQDIYQNYQPWMVYY